MSSETLTDLARQVGLLPQWTDAHGQPQIVSQDTLRNALQALDYPASSEAELEDSRDRLNAHRDALPALIIARPGERIRLKTSGAVRVYREDGSALDLSVRRDESDAQAVTAPSEIGYFRIEIGGESRALALTPKRCFGVADAANGRKLSALAVQLYSLRGGQSGGFGDLASLSDLAAAAAPFEIDAIAVSPIHALRATLSENRSPYSPSTRFFRDPIYADVTRIGAKGAPDDGLPGLVDWLTAAPIKLAVLREAFLRFREQPPTESFSAYCQLQGARLTGHARFQALDEYFRTLGISQWRDWPHPFQNPSSNDVEAFAKDNEEAIAFQVFLQWLTDESVASAQAGALASGMAVGLIADLAVGMDPNGSHAWSAPEELLFGLSVGAPPDVFNTQGQDWGLTALSPTGMESGGYASFLATVRAAMRHSGGVRIDHMMGARRLWLVPKGGTPRDGVYLNYPMEQLLALVALESVRHRAIVIGEDLGTLPDGFRTALFEHGIHGMEVLLFQRDWNNFLPPQSWKKGAAALTTTHDLPPIAGWWQGRDIDWLEKLGRKASQSDIRAERSERARDRERLWSAMRDAGSTTGDLPTSDESARAVTAAIDFVGRTPCDLAIVPMEDMLGLSEQPNIPGTLDEHPNWRRRLPPGGALEDPTARKNLDTLRRARTSP